MKAKSDQHSLGVSPLEGVQPLLNRLAAGDHMIPQAR